MPVRLIVILCATASACGGGSGADPDSGATSDGAGFDASDPIIPDDPGAADIQVRVDTGLDLRAISPFVYGTNQPEWSGRGAHITLSRAGGNRWTAYNWENNASNAGSDYLHQNDGYLGGGDIPGEAVRAHVAEAHANGAAALVTVPIIDYVAADKNGGGDVSQTPNYLDVRFKDNHPAKGSAFSNPPDTGDDDVYQDELVSFLEDAFPDARTDPRETIFYSLDNEPDLWSETHARVHPQPVRYDELVQRNRDYAIAIKAVAPSALVFGFVSYGWNGYVTLQDAPDAAGRDFIDYYLGAMAAAETSAGTRLLDVLDLHWYPEATGGGVRITADDAGDAIAAARMQAPRSLWDPSYTEDSWITQFSTLGPIELLPRMQAKIDAAYPGTRLAITEYYYGGGDHVSGGIAQADVLGIYGREGLFAATLWHLGNSDDSFIWAGFNAYLDYDGASGRFGDTSVRATTSAHENSSAYASIDAGSAERVVIVLINKEASARTAGLAVTHHVRFGTAEVYRFSAGSALIERGDDLPITLTNAVVYTMPAHSVTTLVLQP
ncbi:MAG TPA: glycoside hydrolase family 44 protein [Kofleriaceae bacterium]|nr:glycoside hydrolase family 44 protein [Kofleriaceae bacterium]